jgi:hypothetical protein
MAMGFQQHVPVLLGQTRHPALDECPTEDRDIVDAGLKALAFDSGPAARLRRARRDLRERVGRARQARPIGASNRLGLGDKIPGHCDPNVNLYDWYVCVRDNRVGRVWPIATRCALCWSSSPAISRRRENPTGCGSGPIDQSRPSVATP